MNEQIINELLNTKSDIVYEEQYIENRKFEVYYIIWRKVNNTKEVIKYIMDISDKYNLSFDIITSEDYGILIELVENGKST